MFYPGLFIDRSRGRVSAKKRHGGLVVNKAHVVARLPSITHNTRYLVHECLADKNIYSICKLFHVRDSGDINLLAPSQ